MEASRAAPARVERLSEVQIGQALDADAAANVRCTEEVVFTVERGWLMDRAPRLDGRTSIGELVRVLLGVVSQRPRYIHPADVQRYTSLLLTFSQQELPEGLYPGWRGGRVEAYRISELGRALRAWIRTAFQSPDPFMVSLALDLVTFIDAHCCGHTFTTEQGAPLGRIQPLFNEQLAEEVSRALRFIDEPQLKREVTEELSGVTVRVRVPDDERMRTSTILRGELPGGSTFVFTVRRCHLSAFQGTFNKYPALLPVYAPFDIANGFEFEGEVHFAFIPPDGNPLPAFANDDARTTFQLPAIVPYRWFSELLKLSDRGRSYEWVPLRETHLASI